MALAYATDLATGQSRDFALRSCVLSMRLAKAAGLDEHERRNVYHQALLRYVGCNADTHLLAAAFGDEIALRQDLARIDLGNSSQVVETFVRALNRLFADTPAAELAGAVERGLAEAMQVSVPILAGHCEVAKRIGQRVGLPDEICENLGQLYERWDGHGLPNGLKGDAVGLAVRLVTDGYDGAKLPVKAPRNPTFDQVRRWATKLVKADRPDPRPRGADAAVIFSTWWNEELNWKETANELATAAVLVASRDDELDKSRSKRVLAILGQ